MTMGVNRANFNSWYNEGNAVRVAVDKYREQSTQWKKVFTLAELEKFYIKEYQQ